MIFLSPLIHSRVARRYAADVTSRSERAQQTRDAMIQAGMRLAETTGLAGMSVNLVVKEAGVAKGSFFHHFGDRAGYLLALHRTFYDKLLSDTLKVTADMPPGAERLWAAAVAYLDGCLRSRGVRALLLEARAVPLIAEEIRKRANHLASLCEPHFAAMGWPHPMESARLWMGMVAQAALIEFDSRCRQPVLREALRQFLD
jgi:TetR/AcrR family transcriptional regulator, transcriptional repressor for nem operon